MFEEDDLLAELGVEIPWPAKGNAKAVGCGEKAPKEEPRHTEWNNCESFRFTGYVARVVQVECECCGNMSERLEGIFSEETKIGTGAKRLTALSERGQWPLAGGHRCEVRQERTRWCPECVRGMGFDREVEAPGPVREIVIPAE